MSGKGAHINVLGERIRRYYEHLMADAHTFVDGLRKDLEGPRAHRQDQRTAASDARHRDSSPSSQGPSSSGASSQNPATAGPSAQPGKRAH